ncbi:MAG: hypothetical protein EZS28_007195 [Streblomastix strix]|uniref:Uncharacterized protein n=1 Tax=Streblomastix strix TaxID=222440 RepID=A0A5J4WQ54_9EUKA|nr:MAG: hypothetical protein EZS28_007195 [Streblomastix strix]
MTVDMLSIIKQLVQKVGKDLQWANDNVYKPFIKTFAKPIHGALGPIGQTIDKSLDVVSSILDYCYGAVVQLTTSFYRSFQLGTLGTLGILKIHS